MIVEQPARRKEPWIVGQGTLPAQPGTWTCETFLNCCREYTVESITIDTVCLTKAEVILKRQNI